MLTEMPNESVETSPSGEARVLGSPSLPAGIVEEDPADFSVLRFFNVILGDLRQIVAWAAGGFILGLLVALLSSPAQMAQSQFMPQGSDNRVGRLGGIAAQFGVELGAAGVANSPELYAAIATSRALLSDLVMHEWIVPIGEEQQDTLRGDLIELYEIQGETAEGRMKAGIARLRKDVSTSLDLRAGLVTLSTIAPWVPLAEAMNRRLLTLINEFNLDKRRAQAREERRFIEERLDSAVWELRQSEAALASFLEQNRSYDNSPQLRFQADRLEGEVQRRRQLHTFLAQQYEEARIEEVRSTPLIVVVDEPEGSAIPAGRSLIGTTLLGLLLGLFGGLSVAFGRVYLLREKAVNRSEWVTFHATVDQLRARAGRWVPSFLRRRPADHG